MVRVARVRIARNELLVAELFTGSAWSLPTPLVIQLAGERRVVRAR